jgi:peptidoglycan hydrolase-like protein with peptidoglycan-binding domain
VPQVDRSLRRFAALALVVLAACLTVASSAGAANSGQKVTTKQIQKALGIKADGVMGPRTRRAIKRFQKAHGLKADGIAGPATLEALGLTGTPKNGSLDSAQKSPDEVAAVLAQIAQCESGGDPTAVSPSGQYRGKYQFSQETWESLGGTGDPAEAPESVQDTYAAALYNQRGLAPWPACSQQVSASAG